MKVRMRRVRSVTLAKLPRWGEVHVDPGVGGQPVADLDALVRGVVAIIRYNCWSG
jgi:hypothetical protein